MFVVVVVVDDGFGGDGGIGIGIAGWMWFIQHSVLSGCAEKSAMNWENPAL